VSFKFIKSALCSSKNVMSRLAILYIRCSDSGHQLTLMNVQMDMPMPIYVNLFINTLLGAVAEWLVSGSEGRRFKSYWYHFFNVE